MEVNKVLRIIAGILCLIVAILRIMMFFFDFEAALVYSALFIDPNEAVNLIEGILTIFFASIMTIFSTILAVIIYIVLGILQITLRKYKTPSIICNVFIVVSLVLSIRAIAIYASINEFNIILTTLMVLYIIIFSLCIASYIKFRK